MRFELGVKLSSRYIEHGLNRRVDHEMYSLKPRHHFFEGHPSVNDLLPNTILSGQLQIKGRPLTRGPGNI